MLTVLGIYFLGCIVSFFLLVGLNRVEPTHPIEADTVLIYSLFSWIVLVLLILAIIITINTEISMSKKLKDFIENNKEK